MPTQSFSPLLASSLFGDSWSMLNGSDAALRANFEGPSEPPATIRVAYMFWADTTSNILWQRNAANNAWIAIGLLGQSNLGLLPKSGGAMTGAIDAGGFALTNLGLGSGLAAARVQELDLKAPLAGPLFTGDARVNQDPLGNDSLTRRSWTEGRYVKLTGSTLTGPLVLVGNAAADLEAVPRQQMRDFLGFSTTVGHRHDGADARKVRMTDIDSTGQAVGTMPRSNGSGATVWQAPVLTQIVFRDAPELIVDITTSPGTYQDVDVSAHTTSDAYVILLRIVLGSSGVSLRFRPNGSANDNANMNRGPMSADSFYEIWVPLEQSSRIFEWRYAIGSSTTTKFYLVGYKRAMF